MTQALVTRTLRCPRSESISNHWRLLLLTIVFAAIALLVIPARSHAADGAAADKAQPTSTKPASKANTLNVTITGVPDKVAENIRALLGIYRFNGKTVPGTARLRYLHQQAESDIRQAMAPFGYYHPEIDTSLKQDGDRWQATYTITPGTVMPYGKISIALEGEGKDDRYLERLLDKSPLKTGQPLSHADYEGFKTYLQNEAIERGYYDATYSTQRLGINLDTYEASVTLVLKTGPRYRIGKISFSDSPVRQELLERYLTFKEGDYINSRKLLNLQSALADSEYFGRIEVQPRWDQAKDGVVPIDVTLEPNKRSRYRFGLGYGTDTGARMRFDQTRRWVNDRGHKFNTSLLLSEVKNDLTLNYIIPGEQPQTDEYRFTTSYATEDSDTTKSETLSVGSSWQKTLDNNWQRTLSIDLEQENYTLDNEDKSSLFLLPGAEWSYTKARNPLNPRQGYRLSFNVLGGLEGALSDTTFVQGAAHGKYIFSVTPKMRLLARADVGSTWADDFNKIPTSHRFYAGGDNSVRGYAYKSLGPTNSDGDVVGGQYLLVGSLEADYQVKEDWRAAVFFDSGNAFDDYSESMNSAVGVGVRWQSPVGPVRVDLAHPLNEDRTVRLHFSLGPDL
ncbi:autotransporter assembly complex protein TamA [Pokkaliibacter sp. CJK22405]|uniref:autotransporter assembly complex protein TamA n=1 Tax=Pokkaliibacter sp. CJK22405 TaxID=3384615 RepID=UPI003984E61F